VPTETTDLEDPTKETAMKHEVLPMPRATLRGGTVADVMHPGVVTCSYATPLATVARMMTLHRIHAVVVYGDGDMDPGDTNRIWGVVSDLRSSPPRSPRARSRTRTQAPRHASRSSSSLPTIRSSAQPS
jgi:CBS-domain-containing membrane protein